MTAQSTPQPAQTPPPIDSCVRECPFTRMRLLQIFSIVALAVCAYLIYKSFTGVELVGCGATADCDAVLTSRWSNLAGVPVSVFGAALYLATLITTFFLRDKAYASDRLIAWQVLAVLSAAFVAAAAWFITIQAAVLHRFCFYCNTEHTLGLAIAAIVFFSLPVGRRMLPGGRRDPLRITGLAVSVLLLIGFIGVAAIAAGQIAYAPAPVAKIAKQHVQLGKGTKFDVDLGDWPVLGSASAPNLVLELVDYTCPHCHALAPQIEIVRQRYPGQIAIVVLPAPLNSDCNPAVAQTAPMHLDACVLARLVLCVYRADPSKFEQMHHWMYDSADSRTIRETRAEAAFLIGEDALKKALADPWVDDALRRSVKYYVDNKVTAVPTLVFTDDAYTIQSASQQQVEEMFQHQFKLKPADGSRPANP